MASPPDSFSSFSKKNLNALKGLVTFLSKREAAVASAVTHRCNKKIKDLQKKIKDLQDILRNNENIKKIVSGPPEEPPDPKTVSPLISPCPWVDTKSPHRNLLRVSQKFVVDDKSPPIDKRGSEDLPPKPLLTPELPLRLQTHVRPPSPSSRVTGTGQPNNNDNNNDNQKAHTKPLISTHPDFSPPTPLPITQLPSTAPDPPPMTQRFVKQVAISILGYTKEMVEEGPLYLMGIHAQTAQAYWASDSTLWELYQDPPPLSSSPPTPVSPKKRKKKRPPFKKKKH